MSVGSRQGNLHLALFALFRLKDLAFKRETFFQGSEAPSVEVETVRRGKKASTIGASAERREGMKEKDSKKKGRDGAG